MFGANTSPYSQPGEWEIALSSRNLVSNDHYNGTVEQVQRQVLQNYVTNRQNLFDVSVTRVFTKRFSATVGVPFVNATWASRDPAFPLPAPRHEIPQNGRGLGDIIVSGHSWIFDPDTHNDWNVSAGCGIKVPTGNARATDWFPNRVDPTPRSRPVDQSVQPGDGGWGILLDTHAFWRIKRVLLFGSGSYLANPKDTNDTPSIIVNLGIPISGRFEGLEVNSVPDQYLARLGGTVALAWGFSATLAWRMEGLMRYDLIGSSHGWRRPGTAMFLEPGVSYSRGRHTFTFNVPIGYYYNRRANPYTGLAGDATFPRQIFLTSYSIKLGGPPSAPPVITPPAPEAGAEPIPDPVLHEGQAFVRLNITGMTCDECVAVVRQALLDVTGVADATVSLATMQAVVTYDKAAVEIDALLDAVKYAKGMSPYRATVDRR